MHVNSVLIHASNSNANISHDIEDLVQFWKIEIKFIF